MQELAKEMGYDFEVILAKEIGYSFSKEIEGWDEPYRAFASKHLAGRLAFEFLSLRWFMQMEKNYMDAMVAEVNKEMGSLTNR